MQVTAASSGRTGRPNPSRFVNAMTVDVEDYFHVSAFSDVIRREDWSLFESRVCRNTERLLEMFAEFDVRATFFVLGWVAERHPELVRRIASENHEIASHGYNHQLIYQCSPEEFRADIRRAKAILESVSGRPVMGYRAPSFSITNRSLWALDILIEEGYAYDASIYPIYHDRYGIAGASRDIHLINRSAGSIWEVPGSTVRWAGVNLPIGGGGYFRLMPYLWTHAGIRHRNTIERQPAIFYVHPWEIDVDQPRLHASPASRFRHYRNLDRTEPRLRRLLRRFEFGPLEEVISLTTAAPLPGVSWPRLERPMLPLAPTASPRFET